MTPEYKRFLATKAPVVHAVGIDRDVEAHPSMKPHQRDAVKFALRKGRAALWHDTGLGKTFCELDFAYHAAMETNAPALILTPLAVAWQISREADRFGYDARVIREQSEAKPGINICNYDRLDKLDPDAFGTIVLDESSILKAFSGKTTRSLIQAFGAHRFRLAATATPAPNDHMELGNHAAFLGIMPASDMLQRWFVNDTQEASQTWRLKGHAASDFWDWCASWACMAQTPADMGYDDSEYRLPPMNIVAHKVEGGKHIGDGLFGIVDVSASNMFDVKRQTSAARAERLAEIVNGNKEPWVIWCDTNDEADALTSRIPDAVEVRGSHTIETKEEKLAAFANGQARVIVSKPSICGFGLNWQHCAHMAFIGRSFSYEAWYQAVRRCWRFGQTRPVTVHLMVAEGEDQIGRVIDRKAEDHDKMRNAMRAAMLRAMGRASSNKIAYNPTFKGRVPAWLQSSNV